MGRRKNWKTQKLPIDVRFSRYQNHDGPSWNLEITDSVSRCIMFEVTLDNDQFADMLSSRYMHAEAQWGRLDLLGCEQELKQVTIDVTDAKFHPKAEAEKSFKRLIKPHETDGWTARDGDFGNGHRISMVGDRRMNEISMSRHVRPDGTPVLD